MDRTSFTNTGGGSIAVAALHNEALPSYRERRIRVDAVLTDNGREYCGTKAQPTASTPPG